MSDTQQLIRRAADLSAEVERTHRYSVSRIYGLWNEIFEKNEKPQSCAGCLIRKVKEIRAWLTEQDNIEETDTEMPQTEVAETVPQAEAISETESPELTAETAFETALNRPRRGRPRKTDTAQKKK